MSGQRIGGVEPTRRGWLGRAAVAVFVATGLGCSDGAPDPASRSAERGAALFAEHCIDCHGTDARGRGPIAEGLRAPPSDLTRIAARRAGVFPMAEVRRMVDGRSDFEGHRDVEMPLWGDFFDGDVDAKIEALARYLESIQEAEADGSQASRTDTGQELFLRYCASCHGPEGRGDGPVAASLATPPPDLTTLAARAGGPLDPAAVMATIDGRRDVAAHGAREMPVWGVAFTSEHLIAGERQAGQISLLLSTMLAEYVVSIQEP